MTAVIVLTVTERKKNNNLGWIFKKKITVLVFYQGAFYLQEVCNIYHLSLAIK